MTESKICDNYGYDKCKCMEPSKTDDLLPCPFCGGEVIEYRDEYGGGSIQHKEGHKLGSMQKCILTDVTIDTSSKCHAVWNTRHQGERK